MTKSPGEIRGIFLFFSLEHALKAKMSTVFQTVLIFYSSVFSFLFLLRFALAIL